MSRHAGSEDRHVARVADLGLRVRILVSETHFIFLAEVQVIVLTVLLKRRLVAVRRGIGVP